MGPSLDSLLAEQLETQHSQSKPGQPQQQQAGQPPPAQQEETLSVTAAQRAALLRKLTVSVPGKSSGDLEDHLNWCEYHVDNTCESYSVTFRS